MVTKSAFLYLSQSERFKKFLTRFKSFNNVTRRFVAGEELADAVEAIRQLNRRGISASFDHLGESITSEGETRKEVNEYVRVLDSIHESRLDSNVSVKLTQLGLDVSQDLCYANTRTIVEAALRYNNFVRIDMEDSTKTDGTLQVFKRLRVEFENVGSSLYHGIATHDENMIAATIQFAKERNLSPDRFEFQMLYGIRRDRQDKLVRDGYRMRVYVPYGRYWYPYFMRRLAERPANVWFVLRNVIRS